VVIGDGETPQYLGLTGPAGGGPDLPGSGRRSPDFGAGLEATDGRLPGEVGEWRTVPEGAEGEVEEGGVLRGTTTDFGRTGKMGCRRSVRTVHSGRALEERPVCGAGLGYREVGRGPDPKATGATGDGPQREGARGSGGVLYGGQHSGFRRW